MARRRGSGGVASPGVKVEVGLIRLRSSGVDLRSRSTRANGSEEAVRLVVRTRREEQPVRRPIVRGAVSELERPEAIDRKPPSIEPSDRANELERAVRGLDMSVVGPKLLPDESGREAEPVSGSTLHGFVVAARPLLGSLTGCAKGLVVGFPNLCKPEFELRRPPNIRT